MNTRQGIYYDWIDIAKGLGIILVVFNHGIFPLHEAIHLFHMPFFFFLAGITLNPNTEFGVFVKKKISRIFVPYLFFSLISFIVAQVIGTKLADFNGPLWFLQTLFFSLIISYLLINERTITQVICLGLMVLYDCWILLNKGSTAFYFDQDFDRVLRCIPYIVLGYYSKTVLTKSACDIKKIVVSIVFLLLVYSLLAYYSIFIAGATGCFVYSTICQYNLVLFFLCSIVGSLLLISFSQFLAFPFSESSNTHLNSHFDRYQSSCTMNCIKRTYIRFLGYGDMIIKYLGKNSLVIMSTHYPLMQYLNQYIGNLPMFINGTLLQKSMLSIISFLLAMLFCIVCVVISKRFVPRLTGYSKASTSLI